MPVSTAPTVDDLPVASVGPDSRRLAATRALGSRCEDPEGAKLEQELSAVVNRLGVGPQGLGGDSTSFAVHVETAATHITMNPVAVNMQCHSARRATAEITDSAVSYGF